MTSNRHTAICRDYAEKCFRRAVESMSPPGFTPDWADRPSYFKIYEDATRLALPLERPASSLAMQTLLTSLDRPPMRTRTQLDLNDLAVMLYFAYGILSRRLRVRPDQGMYRLAKYRADLYGRGTASGGGLYPAEIYWACGAGGAVLPGLYHYDTAHHAMERLSSVDATQHIQQAVFAHPAALGTNQFLLLTLNFWKNAFKYDNFSYHVVTQDLGALLCSLWLLARGSDLDWQPILWYMDEALNQLLGLQQESESVFAVLPLPPTTSGVTRPSQPPTCLPPLPTRTFQRSHTVRAFKLNSAAHRGTLISDEPRPAPDDRCQPGRGETAQAGQRIPLPPPAPQLLTGDLLTTFQQRHSNFGTFVAGAQLTATELATVLSLATGLHSYRSDVKAANIPLTRLCVFINNVEGIAPGAYAYDAAAHTLRTIRQQDLALFLQQHYLLQNYNIADAAAVLAITGNLEGMLATYGNRGYRLLNAEAGLMAQGISMICSALSIGCGAVLGFANFALNTALELDGTEDKTLLFVLLGCENRRIADLDYRLV